MHEVPLAERMRPRTLEDYLGQGHLVGEDQVLRRSVDGGNVPSMILWGPPGVGKTTFCELFKWSKISVQALAEQHGCIDDVDEDGVAPIDVLNLCRPDLSHSI